MNGGDGGRPLALLPSRPSADAAASTGAIRPLAERDPAAVNIAGLTVGCYVDDGVLPVSRAVARAVERAKDTPRRARCRLVPPSRLRT